MTWEPQASRGLPLRERVPERHVQTGESTRGSRTDAWTWTLSTTPGPFLIELHDPKRLGNSVRAPVSWCRHRSPVDAARPGDCLPAGWAPLYLSCVSSPSSVSAHGKCSMHLGSGYFNGSSGPCTECSVTIFV